MRSYIVTSGKWDQLQCIIRRQCEHERAINAYELLQTESSLLPSLKYYYWCGYTIYRLTTKQQVIQVMSLNKTCTLYQILTVTICEAYYEHIQLDKNQKTPDRK